MVILRVHLVIVNEVNDLYREVFEDQIMISWVGDIGLRFGRVFGWLLSVWGDGDFRVGKIVFVKGDHINNKEITEAFKLQIVIDGAKLYWNKDNDLKDLFDWGWFATMTQKSALHFPPSKHSL